MSKQVTVRDIAQQSGFSFQTVSRVLTGHGHLHKTSTVKKIERIADELGYVRNLYAKSMQSGKTNSIGLIIDAFSDTFGEHVFRGAHDELLQRDYLPILLMHHEDRRDETLVQKLAERRVEGLIIRPYSDRLMEVSEAIAKYSMPVVSVDCSLPGENAYDFIGTADEHGGQIAAEHLLKLGHRRIAFVFHDIQSLHSRKRGFMSALSACPDIEPLVEMNRWIFEDRSLNQEEIKKLFQQKNPPTAVFAGGDFMLPDIYSAIQDLNLRIPDDVSVVGFGDLIMSRYLFPQVTTLHQDAYRIGAEAARLLIEKLKAEEQGTSLPVRQIRYEPNLLVRGSTAAPKKKPASS